MSLPARHDPDRFRVTLGGGRGGRLFRWREPIWRGWKYVEMLFHPKVRARMR